jgi:hypothetical protein
MARKTPNTRNYRAPDRIPEREQQWKTIEKALSSPIVPPGEDQATRRSENVSGRRRNPR